MRSKHYIIIALVGLAAFVGGFLLANTLNRSEIDQMRAEVESKRANANTQNESQAGLNLTAAEIDAKLAESDANPQNFNFQKGLGIALYRYGAMKQDVSIIEKAIKPLERANQIDASDNDVLVALGNSYFDIGYFKKENEPFQKSREYYSKALNSRPKDVELRTDLGLTYFLLQPQDLERAAAEFERSLADDPNHEKTLQFYAQTLVKQGNLSKANEIIERLKNVNPQSPSLAELAELINSGGISK
jgi:tetratricopeptide (TPR) repeat protein